MRGERKGEGEGREKVGGGKERNESGRKERKREEIKKVGNRK